MNKDDARRRLGMAIFITTVTVIAGTTSPSLQAAWPDTSAFANARELSDTELGNMRGRFVSNGTILYFSFSMSSDWRTSAGEALHAQANLNADVSSSQPKVSFQPTVTVVSAEDSQPTQQSGNTGTTIRNNAEGNGTGLSQIIQVGGDGNRASNRFEMEVSTRGAGNSSSSTGNGQTTLTTASGAQLSVQNKPGLLGISIDMADQGRITQQIIANRGLQQSVQLNSNLQQVNNVTRLHVQIQQQTGANMGQIQQTLSSIRDMQRGFRF